MAADLPQLTAEFYQLMLASERLVDGLERAEAQRQALLRRAHDLAERLAAARSQLRDAGRRTLDEAAGNLRAWAATARARRVSPERLRAAYQRLAESYEALLVQLREAHIPLPRGLRVGHIKPRNYVRNVFHVSMALTGVLSYELAVGRTGALWISWSLLALFVAMDIGRRTSQRFNEWLVAGIFGKISRPNEAHRVPAATYYMAAIAVGVLTMPQHAIELGVLVLGFADPAAAIVGKRWGRRKLVGDRSVVGTATFVLVGTLVGVAFLALVAPGLGLLGGLAVAGPSALVGALAELGGGRVDDNLTIPLAAGLVATLLLA